MPVLQHDDTHLHYTVTGPSDAVAVLAIAPGGMRSAASRWAGAPLDPRAALPDHRVIAMDQRNAGASTAPVTATDGWHVYTADQVALLDHLGVERFHVVGMCIGGPYALRLALAVPDRVLSVVLFQPIGLDDNRAVFYGLFDDWAASLRQTHPEADDGAWAAFRAAMFGGDFLFGVSREEAARVRAPALLLEGDDVYHPAPISKELATILPDVTYVPRWKDPAVHEATRAAVRAHLHRHDP